VGFERLGSFSLNVLQGTPTSPLNLAHMID
jgi:hypothetical protein